MGKLKRKDLIAFIELNIQIFHKKRLDGLLSLSLIKILKRKNPYLFKAKALDTAQDMVKSILDAHLSSQEEGIFGGFLEELAIFICGRVYKGKKSSAEGVDLELDKDGTRYVVSIKSGPNWGNSRQIAKMKDDFKKAKRILRTNNRGIKVSAIEGCCYGRDNNPDKGDYHKLCGQRFWEFISGDEKLYANIIEPVGHKAKERNDKFQEDYAKVINRFTLEFMKDYCNKTGAIDWKKLVKFNSGKVR